jgi:hypothetical protein
MTDAERARQYRARRRGSSVTRDVTNVTRHVTQRDVTAVTPNVTELVTAVTELVTAVTELVTLLKHERDANVTVRDGENVTASRHVTSRHGGNNESPARKDPAPPAPLTGGLGGGRSSEPLRLVTDAVTPTVTAVTSPQLERIAAMLRAAGAPVSAASLALELEAPVDKVRRVLEALVEVGRVTRSEGADGSDRWELAGVTSPGETIRCEDYQAHRFEHRRDAATGRFRCYVCEPELVEVSQ